MAQTWGGSGLGQSAIGSGLGQPELELGAGSGGMGCVYTSNGNQPAWRKEFKNVWKMSC